MSTNQELEEELKAIRLSHNLIKKNPIVRFLWKNQETWSVDYVSENVKNIFGYTADDFLSGKVIYSEIIYPEDLQRVEKEVSSQAKSDLYSLEHEPYRIINKAGEIKWLNDITLIRRNENNEITHFEGIIIDITDRKEAETKLANKTMLLDNITNRASNISIITTDIDLKITTYNPFAEKFFGDSAEQVIGKTVHEMHFMKNIEPERLTKAFKIIDKTGEYNYIIKQQLPSGKRVLSSRMTKILNPDGELAGYSLFTHDISKQVLAEDELKENEKKFHSVFSDISNISVQGYDKNRKVIYWNKASETLYGYSKEEVINKNLEDLIIPPEMRETVISLVDNWHENNIKIPNGELTLLKKDGSPVHVFSSHVMIEKSDGEKEMFCIDIDITERKQAEEALKASEERFRTVANFTYDWEYWISPQDEFIFISPSCERITGYSQNEFKQNPKLLTSIVHPDDINNWENHKHNVFYKAEIETIEFRIITKSGEERWIGHVCKTVYDINGVNIGIRGSNRDITKQKNIEQALKVSEDRLSKTLIAANDGMWDWNLITNKVYFDPRYYKMAGYAVDEFPHEFNEFQKRIHPDDIENVMTQAQLHIEGNTTRFYVEFRFKRKNGDWLWVLGRGLIVERDKNNKPLRFIGTHSDITDRKKAQEALKASEEKYRLLTETMKDVVIKISTTGELLYISPATKGFGGYIHEEEVGNKIFNFFAEENDYQRAVKLIADIVETHKSGNFEFLYKTKNNTTFPVELTYVPLIKSGKVYAIQMVLRDITDRKKVEETLKENEAKLRESNKTKDKFFSIIAHDLRGPFNSILGFSDLLLENHKKYNDSEREKYIKVIDNSAKQAYELLNNLLIWASTQTNGIVFKPQKHNLKEVITKLISQNKYDAAKKNIKLSSKLLKEINIYADLNMLKIILRNLISNAIKFTNSNGEIKINAEQDKDKVIISVSDTGVGIKKDKLQKIFDINEKTSTVGTAKEKGSGLGLLLCKEFVEKHGGEIWIESEIEKGSKFVFSMFCCPNDEK